MICWYCHWGWAKPVADIYTQAKRDIDGILAAGPDNNWIEWPGEPRDGETALCYGPAHVVWSDENFDLAESCLKDCDNPEFSDWHPAALELVRQSLRALAALPDPIRECCPANYDGEHPENFPPSIEVTKLR